MNLPQSFLRSFENTAGFDRQAFENIHHLQQPLTSIRLNPSKPITSLQHFQVSQVSAVPWSKYGFYLSERPSFTFDPLFHAGCYYVQEASSMFLEQALTQTVDLFQNIRVLDLCAAPGGKSTHVQSLIGRNSLLVSNEIIRSRVNILKDNIIKWGTENVVVTNNDPRVFSSLENFFDVVVVDAPCSGSGLFRREPEAINEWSEENVTLCSMRQQRILSDVLPSLKKNGILIYSTCSYSKEEDEEIVDWLTKEYLLEYIPIKLQNDWGITDTGRGYRFWPDKLKGEGFFLAVFRKRWSEEEYEYAGTKNKKLSPVSKKEQAILDQWINGDGRVFYKKDELIYSWPLDLAGDMGLLLDKLNVVYSGTIVGEIMKDKLVPDHALAMGQLLRDKYPFIELDYDQAIAYLQRKDFSFSTEKRGWHLVVFGSSKIPLGWVNILPSRINNYYPKSLRILKER